MQNNYSAWKKTLLVVLFVSWIYTLYLVFYPESRAVCDGFLFSTIDRVHNNFSRDEVVSSPSSKNRQEDQKTVVTNSEDLPRNFKVELKGEYRVLKNFILSDEAFGYYDTITMTTISDYTYLDNLVVQVDHWRGPISIALHAPGDDFLKTVEYISYLRHCESNLIKRYVTFHLFFPADHLPETDGVSLISLANMTYDCEEPSPIYRENFTDTYRQIEELPFPVNVARNIAIEGSNTLYVLPIDLELYPSYNFIPKFLKMIERNPEYRYEKNVYVLPVFEVTSDSDVPETKTRLQEMFKNKTAIEFHVHTCIPCHRVPNITEWMKDKESDELNIFVRSKRVGRYRGWEPLFVMPRTAHVFYDERLTWEGMSDKMSVGYELCLLDYDFAVLDNAYLVHRPGIKFSGKENPSRMKWVSKINNFRTKKLRPELDNIYGARPGCYL